MTRINSRSISALSLSLSLSDIYVHLVKVSRGLGLGLLICCDSIYFFFNTHPLHVSLGSLRTITNVILALPLTHFYEEST